MAILKRKVPNPPGLDWKTIEIGLSNEDPSFMVDFAEITTDKLMKQVIPVMQQQSTDQQQKSAPTAAPEPEKKTPDEPTKQGSGFINGDVSTYNHPTEIKGFISSVEPIDAY